MSSTPLPCPCDPSQSLDECCGPMLTGCVPAKTAEELMRSRFTAHALANEQYLAVSWAPETRPSDVHVIPDREWTRLEIVDTERGRQLDVDGVVEFRAHWEWRGEHGVLSERSRFRRENGRWVYVDGL